MDAKKIWCSVVDGAVWSDRCLYKLSKIIEGSKDCESCILHELEQIKPCGKEAKAGKKRKPKARKMKGAKSIVDVPNDINDISDINDVDMSDNIKQSLNVQDLSKLLGKSKRRIEELANLGKIPGHKVGRHWKFLKEEIDEWLSGKRAVSLHCSDNVMTTTEASPGQNPRPPDQNDEGSPNHGG
jgi:excisionase family DNA binding protein